MKPKTLNIFFFVLPFFLLGGIALQQFGFYILGILLPLWYLKKSGSSAATRKHAASLGWVFLVTYLVFPLSNVINIVLPMPALLTDMARPEFFPVGKLFVSHFGSALWASGVILILLPRITSGKATDETPKNLLTSFSHGMLAASTLLLIYALIQHFTGFDYREASHVLPDVKRLPNGTYRILGFFGHPLSMAGVALTIFSFYWGLCIQHANRVLCGLVLWSAVRRTIYGYLATAAIHLYLVILSGGRFASGVALLLLAGTPFLLRFRQAHGGRNIARLRLMITGGVALLGAIAVGASGMIQRFLVLLEGQQSGEFERLTFWKVHLQMFLDQPFVGHGIYWLGHYQREWYYNRLGFETLATKYNAHNIYLETLASVGLIGSLVIIAMVFVGARLAGRLAGTSFQARSFLWAILLAIGMNLLNGFTQNVFFDSSVELIYLSLGWVFFWLTVWPQDAEVVHV